MGGGTQQQAQLAKGEAGPEPCRPEARTEHRAGRLQPTPSGAAAPLLGGCVGSQEQGALACQRTLPKRRRGRPGRMTPRSCWQIVPLTRRQSVPHRSGIECGGWPGEPEGSTSPALNLLTGTAMGARPHLRRSTDSRFWR
jgi:hypothetical protein